MTYLFRALCIAMALFAVASVLLQLERTPWAERVHLNNLAGQLARLKYEHAHATVKTPPPRPRPPINLVGRYGRSLVEVVILEMGLPGAATLGILAIARRKRRQAGPLSGGA